MAPVEKAPRWSPRPTCNMLSRLASVMKARCAVRRMSSMPTASVLRAHGTLAASRVLHEQHPEAPCLPHDSRLPGMWNNHVLASGVHFLSFAVQGDIIVGFAAASSGVEVNRTNKAWGVSTATGCLHYCSTQMDEGMPGLEIGPQRLDGDTAERLLQFELNLDDAKVRLRHGTDSAWIDVPLRLPAAVHPWALIPTDHARDVTPVARLVSCESARIELNEVKGLDEVVGHVHAAAQRRALQWCTERGIGSSASIVELGKVHAFISAIGCRPYEINGVRRRLTGWA